MNGQIDERSDLKIPSTKYKLDEHLITVFNPISPVSESFRRLRTGIQFAQLDVPIKTFLITSPAPSEGKTTIAANLAVVFAQTDNRVLLVDTDLRRPKMHTLFGLKKSPGITDYLFGKVKLEDVIHRDVLENLDVLCCGTSPPNPAEILGSKKMKEFIEQTKVLYDYILFDSPPLLAVTDAAVLATVVDGAVLVVSAGMSNIPSLDRAIEQITNVSGRMLGVLLNNFDLVKAYGGYYRSYRYGYYAKEYRHYHSTSSQYKKH